MPLSSTFTVAAVLPTLAWLEAFMAAASMVKVPVKPVLLPVSVYSDWPLLIPSFVPLRCSSPAPEKLLPSVLLLLR